MRFAAALALSLLALPAAAQDLAGTTLVTADGACKRFTVSGVRYRCNGFIYMSFPNGRVSFNFAMPDGAIMLSGGSDSQIDPRRYILNIDRIRAGRGDGSSQPYPAKGRCVMIGTVDGNFVRSLTCSATNGTETVNVEFIGSNKPVKIKHL